VEAPAQEQRAAADRVEEAAVPQAASTPADAAPPTAQAEQALALLDRAVAHDMRAGLGVVTGFGKLLKHRLAPSDAAIVEQIDALHDSAREVVGLVDAWRAAGLVLRQPMTLATVDMEELARRAAVAADAASARITFEAGMPAPVGDAALLERVWRELLDNAVKFARAGQDPDIEAWGRLQDGVPVYGVRDGGIGIPPSRADRLFRPLQRLHGDLYAGVGLGLFIASALVARHGGTMWVEERGEDAGTCVCFRLQG
jgi:light-regulated signal transduction histidine kinase (bacteriophytochrome)